MGLSKVVLYHINANTKKNVLDKRRTKNATQNINRMPKVGVMLEKCHFNRNDSRNDSNVELYKGLSKL